MCGYVDPASFPGHVGGLGMRLGLTHVPPCSVELHWWSFACSHWHQWLSLLPSLALPSPPQFGLCESSHMLCCTWSVGEGQGGRGRGERRGERKRERKTGIRGCQVNACQTYTMQASKPFWIPYAICTKKGKLRRSIWKHKSLCILYCTQSDPQYLETGGRESTENIGCYQPEVHTCLFLMWL